MSRKTTLLITVLVIGILAIAAVGVSAQGGNGNNGGGNGNQAGNGTQTQQQNQQHQQNQNQTCIQDCDMQGNQMQMQNGPGGPNADAPGYGPNEPQANAYRWGGPENGMAWQARLHSAGNRGFGDFSNLPPVSDVELTAEQVAAMTAGLNDERNAYAIYEAVIADFGRVFPFVNIMQAEAQHEAAWEFLFDRYGLELPANEVSDVPHFDTVQDACAAAAAAEIANFGLYDDMLQTLADYPDMVQVITSLRNASEFNHLPAFEKCAS